MVSFAPGMQIAFAVNGEAQPARCDGRARHERIAEHQREDVHCARIAITPVGMLDAPSRLSLSKAQVGLRCKSGVATPSRSATLTACARVATPSLAKIACRW